MNARQRIQGAGEYFTAAEQAPGSIEAKVSTNTATTTTRVFFCKVGKAVMRPLQAGESSYLYSLPMVSRLLFSGVILMCDVLVVRTRSLYLIM